MDINLTNYGWSGSADCSILNNNMLFNTEGYLINEKTMLDNKKQHEIRAEFIYNSLDIGLIIWYNNEIGYLKYTVNNNEIKLERVRDSDNVRLLARKYYGGSIVAPVKNQTISLKAIVNGDNVKCYYNDVEVINIEQRLFDKGLFGVHASNNEVCSTFSVESKNIENWQVHIENGAYLNNIELGKIEIKSLSNKYTYIYQEVDTSINGSYSISFDYVGSPRLEIYNGSTMIGSKDFAPSIETSRASYVIAISSIPRTIVKIGSKVDSTVIISKPQIEQKPFDTSFTFSTRDKSSLTFPCKQMNINDGGLGMIISPIYDYSNPSKPMPIFYYNDRFNIEYKNGLISAVYGDTNISVSKQLAEGKTYYLYMIWRNKISLMLGIVEMDGNNGTYNTIGISEQVIPREDYVYIGSTPTDTGNLIVDNLVVYKNYVTSGMLEEHMLDQNYTSENVIIKANFDRETLIYNRNRILVPTPKPGSPLIIQRSDGEVYNRVCFIDGEKYTIYNKEEAIYSDLNSFELSHNDILTIEAEAPEYGLIFNNIEVEDIVISGRRTGKSIAKILDDSFKDIADGALIVFTYTIKNTFCLNYDDEYKQYDVILSNVDDEDLLIQYEEESGLDKKLIRTVELNPFKSINNYGFIYIDDTARKLETFDVKITPDSIMANGYDIATISIDCFASDGSSTSNVDIEVASKFGYGEVSRFIDEDEQLWLKVAEEEGEDEAINRFGDLVTDEHRSGRFIFKYKAKHLINGEYEIIDQLVIKDRVSKIGIQIPIRLVRGQ